MGPKGSAVCRLEPYASRVQSVVRQFGPLPRPSRGLGDGHGEMPELPTNPWGPWGLDPGFDPDFPRKRFLDWIHHATHGHGPGSSVTADYVMGDGNYGHPRFGTGDAIGQAFVGLGRFVRMCIIPNEFPPGIPPGGLFGPEAPIPWGRFPGYKPPSEITHPEILWPEFSSPGILGMPNPGLGDLTFDPETTFTWEDMPGVGTQTASGTTTTSGWQGIKLVPGGRGYCWRGRRRRTRSAPEDGKRETAGVTFTGLAAPREPKSLTYRRSQA